MGGSSPYVPLRGTTPATKDSVQRTNEGEQNLQLDVKSDEPVLTPVKFTGIQWNQVLGRVF